MAGALDGVRVIDLTGIGMGPMATQLLGDMGADVIKVESPGGDLFRHVTPRRNDGMSHAFVNLNRNKRSVVIDLKSAAGVEHLLRLLDGADVLISNLRPQAMRRLGLDPATLQGRFPRLIQCGCYGFGDAGPYAGRPAIDDTIQAASGLAWLQGRTGDREPGYVNTVAADKVVGLYAANAITAALYARERTGEGQAIEVPMFECMVAFTVAEHLSGRTFVPSLGEAGYDRLLNEQRRPFRTSDGHISVVPYTDAQWRRFFELSGHPEMAEDPRYRSASDRSRHFPELYRFVGDVIRLDSTEVWVRRLEDSDIPFSTVNSIDALLTDPHLQAVGFWREVEHPTEGTIRQAGFPVGFSATPADVRRHAPSLGEHTDEVLGRTPDTGDPPNA